MAEPYKKNGRWYVRYKDGRGAWRDRATRAQTKGEARRIQLEIDRKHERQRLGLEPLPSDTPEQTFAEAMDLWWSEHGKRLRSSTIRRFMEKHLRPESGRCLCRRLATGSNPSSTPGSECWARSR